jgi:hypothetical protein
MANVHNIQFLVYKKFCQDVHCLRKVTAHQRLYAQLQQPDPPTDVDILRGVKAEDHSSRAAQSCGEKKRTSKDTATMDEIAEEFAITSLVDGELRFGSLNLAMKDETNVLEKVLQGSLE